MRARARRAAVIAVAGVVLSGAVVLAALALRDAAAFFQTPTDFLETPPEEGRSVRVGGLVTPGSLRADGNALIFALADDERAITVRYAGPTPNLFREGQCVIAEGSKGADAATLIATRLLAKHDEAYIPPEIDSAPRLARSCGPSLGAGA